MKISVQELLIVLLIVLVIFGPTQLPKLAKTIGESLKGFKKGMEDDTHEQKEQPTADADTPARVFIVPRISISKCYISANIAIF